LLQILESPKKDGTTIAPILTDTIPVCVYDDKKVEDIKEFDGDDPIDNLRYLCKFARRYMNGQVGEELERRQRVQTVVEQYHQDHNTTAFYRNMERLEENQSKESFGVQRSRSRRRH
jgi:hypothetical protein